MNDHPPSDPVLEDNPAARLAAAGASIDRLRDAARVCRACPLYAVATQTVFGEGAEDADIALVGEQPGDVEDKEGSPFVGPAGRLLWEAIDSAGIPHSRIYVTNVVKHFKWTGGKWRRLHAKPNRREVEACLPWLEAEIHALEPNIIVGLGATACQALLGPRIRVTRDRGLVKEWRGVPVLITLHPSAILRADDAESRRHMLDDLVADLGEALNYPGSTRSARP